MFEELEYIPGGLRGWQGMWSILRRKRLVPTTQRTLTPNRPPLPTSTGQRHEIL